MKTRVTVRDGMVGVYDANVSGALPFIFREVLFAEVSGSAYRVGGGLDLLTVDGVRVQTSGPMGCGCGDKGKRYTWPQDYDNDVIERA